MASTSNYKPLGSLFIIRVRCFLTPDDMHLMCVMCMGEEHARSVLEGLFVCIVNAFHEEASLRHLSLSCRNLGQPFLPRGSGPAAAEAE